MNRRKHRASRVSRNLLNGRSRGPQSRRPGIAAGIAEPLEGRLLLATINGYLWNDLNNNGVRDPSLVISGRPDVVFIVDASRWSLDALGAGAGDRNNDGTANTFLDGEIQLDTLLNQDLIARGFGTTSSVGIVVMSTNATIVDLDPAVGLQSSVNPSADSDGDGMTNVEEALRGITASANGTTNYLPALQAAETLFTQMGTPLGNGNIIFLTDRQPDAYNYAAEVQTLTVNQLVPIRAFGVGPLVPLAALQIMDRNAAIYPTTQSMIPMFQGPNGTAAAPFTEPGLAGWTVYLDINGNRIRDAAEPFAVTDAQGNYSIANVPAGTYTLTEVVQPGWRAGTPASGQMTITVTDATPYIAHFGNASFGGAGTGSGTISGIKWNDQNRNGVRDGGADAPPITLVPQGPIVLTRNDDFSTAALPLGFTFNFYGGTYTDFYINNNGNITFGGPDSTFTASGFPQVGWPMIAPFWADVDTRGATSGQVRLARGTTASGHAFIQVDWPKVGYFPSMTDKLNDFTLYIEDDPAGDVVAFFYRRMQWTTGSASGGTNGFGGTGAQLGFDAGNGVNFKSLGRPNTAQQVRKFQNTYYVWRMMGAGDPFLEPTLPGWKIYLDLNNNGQIDGGEPTTTTDANGAYTFTNVPVGNYTVAEVMQPGWMPTSTPDGQQTVTVIANETTIADFGNAVAPVMPDMSVSNVTVTEGDSGTKNATFTVTLSKPAEFAAAVQYTTVDGTATTANNDYSSTAGVLAIPVGQTSGTFTVPILGDTTYEPDENFSVHFSGPINLNIPAGQDTATCTITNDDYLYTTQFDAPTFSFYENGGLVSIPVRRSGGGAGVTTVAYRSADGTARTGRDYTAVSGILTFNSDGVQYIRVPLIDNRLSDGSRSLQLILSNPTPPIMAVLGPNATIPLTIWDDELPEARIADATVIEGNAGTSNLHFVVSVSATSDQDILLSYAAADGTATAADNDYDATKAGGMLVIPAGQLTGSFDIPVIGDTKLEADESLTVTITNLTPNVVIQRATATGAIVNDDVPILTLSNPTVIEGPNQSLVFTATLSGSPTLAASVDWTTADGTAAAGVKYLAARVTLRFAAGQTTGTIAVPIIDENAAEGDQTLLINLSNASNLVLASNQATGTIMDDEMPSLSVAAASMPEGNSGTKALTFTARLSYPLSKAVTFNYATLDGTALAGKDYMPAMGTVTLAPGQTLATIDVDVIGNTTVEQDKTFSLLLYNPAGATGNPSAIGTIQNDDLPALSIADTTVVQSASPQQMTFKVTLSQAMTGPVTCTWSTSDGTAVAGVDYTAVINQMVVLPAGQTSVDLTVSVLGRVVNGTDRTFTITLGNVSGAGLAQATATGMIQDTSAPTITIADAAMPEGNSGTSDLSFTIRLSHPSQQAVTVQYATANGTATGGADYVPAIGSVTIPPGQTSATVPVQINGDAWAEPNETFTVRLSSPVNGVIGRLQATGAIQDDGDTTLEPTYTLGGTVFEDQNKNGVRDSKVASSLTPDVVFVIDVSGSTILDFGTTTLGDVDNDGIPNTVMDGELAGFIALSRRLDSSSRVAIVCFGYDAQNVDMDPQQPGLQLTIDPTLDANRNGIRDIEEVLRTITVGYNGIDSGDTNFDAALQQTISTYQTLGTPVGGGTMVFISDGGCFYPFDVSVATLRTMGVNMRAFGAGPYTWLDTLLLIDPNAVIFNTGDELVAGFSTMGIFSEPALAGRTIYLDLNNNGQFDANEPSTTTDVDGAFTFAGLEPGTYTVAETPTQNWSPTTPPGGRISVPLLTGDYSMLQFGDVQDNQPLSVSVSDASIAEGDTGTRQMQFTVTLSQPTYQTVTVDWSTADGTATAGFDYASASGTLTFLPGQTSLTLTVPVIGDTLAEPDETLFVALANPSGAVLGDDQGQGYIIDDDSPPPPTVTITDAAITEGSSDPADVFVTLSEPSAKQVTVWYTTADGTAKAGVDYTASGGAIVFQPGQTTIRIPVEKLIIDNDISQPDRGFLIDLLDPTNAVLADGRAIIGIADNDHAPTISVGGPDTVAEGNSGSTLATYTVTLSNPSGFRITVDYATADGAATAADQDYTPASGRLIFDPGQTTMTFTVPVLGDTRPEPDEAFAVVLSRPTNASLATGQATTTIVSDELPDMSIARTTALEGKSGVSMMTFTVSLSYAPTKPVSVDYATAGLNAVAGVDFRTVTGTLNFAAGQTTATIQVPVIGNTGVQGNRDLQVTLSNAVNANLVMAQATGTIIDDDTAARIKVWAGPPQTAVTNGQSRPVDFGTATVGKAGPTRTFLITNAGNTRMLVSQPVVPAGFRLTKAPASTIAPGKSDTFVVQLITSAALKRSGNITFNTTDPVNSRFVIPVTGLVSAAKKKAAPQSPKAAPLPPFGYSVGPAVVTKAASTAGVFSTKASVLGAAEDLY